MPRSRERLQQIGDTADANGGRTPPGAGYKWDDLWQKWVPPGYHLDPSYGDMIPDGQVRESNGDSYQGFRDPTPSDAEAQPPPTAAPAPPPADTSKPSDYAQVPTVDDIGAPIAAARDKRTDQTNDLVDRYSAVQLDTSQADQARQQQDQALGMQKAIYDKLLSYDPAAEAEANAKRTTRQALAVAGSAPGGAASRQAARFQALQQMPAIQSESANAANEQAARNTQLAAQAAAGFAQTAQGTRGQDITQASQQADLGIQVANGIAQAVGRDIQLTSDEAKFLGQAQLALGNLDLNWAQLDEQQRAAKAEEELRKAGLDQQWKQFKESQKVGVLDVIGAITGTARSGVGTVAAGKQAGLW